MAENSGIQWTHHTFNPWYGCTKVSPGCDNCYAEHMMDTRMHKVTWGAGNKRVLTSAAYWNQPHRWNREAERLGIRYRVFCASLADVFDNEVPDKWRRDLWALIAVTPYLDWLLLTKRIGNAVAMLPQEECERTQVMSHVWLGATMVNQEEYDRDITKLLAVPAAVKFLSVEPILGLIDFKTLANRVDWIIVGGESGAKARPTDIAHIRSVVQQCKSSGVPVFVKQLGGDPVSDKVEVVDDNYWASFSPELPGKVGMMLNDRKGGKMDEWPEDLRVREFPR